MQVARLEYSSVFPKLYETLHCITMLLGFALNEMTMMIFLVIAARNSAVETSRSAM